MPGEKEIRCYKCPELRIVKFDDEPAKIVGHAAVFDIDSEDMGFVERIAPGAFKNALARSDARALFNHDSNIILGRQSAGTLKLKEDDVGLLMEATPPDTQLVRDMVLAPIERGDITQQSFGFTVEKDEWTEERSGTVTKRNYADIEKGIREKRSFGRLVRTIIEVKEVFDVSPVTFPAYPDTTVGLRSFKLFKDLGNATVGAGNNRDATVSMAMEAAISQSIDV